jgi:hypothetical protein
MSESKVKVTSESWPPAEAYWQVEVPDDNPEQALIYNNLMFDLIAIVLGKLGVEYSKFAVDGDRCGLNARMAPLFEAARYEA